MNIIRCFQIKGATFCLCEKDGYTCLVNRQHICKLHWAILNDGCWCVFKGSHYRTTIKDADPEVVATKLLAFDLAHMDLMKNLEIEGGKDNE